MRVKGVLVGELLTLDFVVNDLFIVNHRTSTR